MADKTGWFFRVCGSHADNEAEAIKFRAGRDDDDKDHWHAEWKRADNPGTWEVDLPPELRTLNKIWVGVEPYPGGKNGSSCLMYAGDGCKKYFNYDGTHEDEFERGDSDSCPC
jgi:hypothetical protein